MNVLTKEELERLLKVKTTVKQARQIIKRNQAVLRAIQTDPEKSRTFEIGCPHCKWDGDGLQCGKCAYQVKNNDNVVFPLYTACCDYTFGGLKYKDPEISDYIYLRGSGIEYSPYRTTEDNLNAIKTWLQGHIEWGQEVIRRAKKENKRS